MTISDTDPRPAAPHAARAAARPPRPSSKPNGQWKIDGTTPLNGNEEWKQQDGGLAVRERIESTYAAGGFDSIDPTDLHGRFRWWGLYTQRKPGIDGGRTATLEPHELEDRYFMLGDNREQSLDSRYWGLLEGWRLEGRAVFTYFSYNKGSFRAFPWIREIRWGRLFRPIR